MSAVAGDRCTHGEHIVLAGASDLPPWLVNSAAGAIFFEMNVINIALGIGRVKTAVEHEGRAADAPFGAEIPDLILYCAEGFGQLDRCCRSVWPVTSAMSALRIGGTHGQGTHQPCKVQMFAPATDTFDTAIPQVVE